MSGGFRVGASSSVPASVRKTIQNIKEIAGNHSDDEIYAMLKECSMDPNETAQKLLFQDTFHEVKRKRDKRKENTINKEAADHRWRAGMQGRGGRGGRGNLSSRYISHDTGGGKTVAAKENGIDQAPEKEAPILSSSCKTQTSENKQKSPLSSPISAMPNGSGSTIQDNTVHVHAAPVSEIKDSLAREDFVDRNMIEGSLETPLSEVERSTGSIISAQSGQMVANPSQISSQAPSCLSGVYSSSSDPVINPSHGPRVAGAVGAIRREIGSHRPNHEAITTVPSEVKLAAPNLPDQLHVNKNISNDATNLEQSPSVSDKAMLGTGSSSCALVMSKPQEMERNQLQESESTATSTPSGLVVNRPSSNYSSRSQPAVGPQKAVGPSKEWKPKPTVPSSASLTGNRSLSTGMTSTNEVSFQSLPSRSVVSEEATSTIQKKLEELHFSDGQHVIIPNHLQVPESERSALSFGSFGASFDVGGVSSDLDGGKSSTPLSESSQVVDESSEEPSSSVPNANLSNQEEYLDVPQSTPHGTDDLAPSDANVSTNVGEDLESDQTKTDAGPASGGPQYSAVQAAPNYSTFGLIPPIMSGQFPPLESSEPQGCDVSRIPSFVVQQPFDPSTSYYAPFYRPGTDGDARVAQFLVPGSSTKYNGNIAVLSAQSGPSLAESGNSLVLSSTASSPIGAQTAGVMQSSIAVNQQPVPVFRQPAGMHISHYPPNYLHYNQYFPPVYVPPPSLHHFLSNTAFPQQPPAGLMFPPPAAAAATPVKYSLSQYKPGTNLGNATNVGMPAGYGNYSSAPAGYSSSPPVTTGNSSGNEDIGGSQFKENNVYIAGQQSEGSGVWVPAPGRDVSSLQASLFYNLPPQGQHVTFGPTQGGHGAFAGIFHPAQTMAAATVHPLLQQSQTIGPAVEVAGPQAGVYQQSQQINWGNTY
ncbi:GBF-interacting protein 1 [Nymphaea thermarum]|nr:GBF-interacting protein 1 [Nymphaea thermarum]